MPAFETEKIDEFQKHDLFQRYALDNLAGLMLGADKKNPLFRKYIGKKEVLQNRISKVRENQKKPDFRNCVK